MPPSRPTTFITARRKALEAWWRDQRRPDGVAAWRRRGLIGGGGLLAIFALLLLTLLLLDWNLLRGPISAYASARTGRQRGLPARR